MVNNSALDLKVLDNEEKQLGFINTKYVEVEENNVSGTLRNIIITHPITDETKKRFDNTYLNLLTAGNKIWQQTSCDGDSVLYVLHGEKSVDSDENSVSIEGTEVAMVLGEVPPKRYNPSNSSIVIDSSWINNLCGNWFTAGEIPDGLKISYSGAKSPLAMLREVETQTGYFLRFRYEYNINESTKVETIKRYIDFNVDSGRTHDIPIELNYNSDSISWSIDDTEVRIASAPIGDSDIKDKERNIEFHKNMKEFESLAINNKNTLIPYGVTEDENGNTVNTDNLYPPFLKPQYQNYVMCDVSSMINANYININNKEGSSITTPRVNYVEINESNKYNIYWALVEDILERISSEIEIEASVVDILKLKGIGQDYYNQGDIIYIRLKEFGMTYEGLIKETKKIARDESKDSLKIGTPSKSFLTEFLRTTKSYI